MLMTTKLYPHLVVHNNAHPNKLLAFPFLGILIKLIFLTPVWLWFIGLSVVYVFYWIVLPFYILFTGKYWNSAYNFTLGLLRLSTKTYLYLGGITDKYPGFRLNDGGLFTLTIEKPQKPQKLLAFPLLGLAVRIILLIPFCIFANVLMYGSGVAIFVSWFIVLFKGKYPESLYEFVTDTIRVSNAMTAYLTYMSDDYPSFMISMKHQTIKILLIIAGTALMLSNASQQSPKNNQDLYITPQDTLTQSTY